MHPHTAEAPGHCPALTDPAAFREFFQREGYVVVPRALPAAVCAEAVDGFLKEVHLDTRALFQRGAGDWAAHVYTASGQMRDPLVNLQAMPGRRYPQFKAASMALLTGVVLRQAVETLLGEPARLVDSLYADGFAHNHAATAAAPAIGAWIAAEDGDGRAPLMAQGDLLLWDARKTPEAPSCARRAFVGYYARSDPGRPAGVMLGAMEVLNYSEHRSLAGRAAVLLRAEYPLAWRMLHRLRRPWPSRAEAHQ